MNDLCIKIIIINIIVMKILIMKMELLLKLDLLGITNVNKKEKEEHYAIYISTRYQW